MNNNTSIVEKEGDMKTFESKRENITFLFSFFNTEE